MWKERKVEIPDGRQARRSHQGSAERAVFRRARRGRVRQDEDDYVGCYHGYEQLVHYIDFGRQEEKAKSGGKGLVEKPEDLEVFKDAYRRKKFTPAAFQKGSTVGGFIGIDGGSTSTKAVLLDENGDILCKAYQLSNGNPIQDTIEMFENLRKQVEAQSAKLEVLGVGTTGYAKDILKDVLNADVALVETVAHTESALKFYDDPHVIVDVGGQDIKIIILHNGRVKDFKLNTQCSAGNGYFLQSTAEGFGYDVEAVRRPGVLGASHAGLRLRLRGVHAVRHRELPAPGLARGRDPGRAGRGAAEERVPLRGQHSEPRGAGLALRAAGRNAEQPGRREGRSGLHPQQLPRDRQDSRRSSFTSTAANPARSALRRNRCVCGATASRPPSSAWRPSAKSNTAPRATKTRAAISARTTACARSSTSARRPRTDESFVPIQKVTKVPLMHGEQRLIIATCEKGTVEDVNDMKDIKAGLDAIKDAASEFRRLSPRKEVFRPTNAKNVADPLPTRNWAGWNKGAKSGSALMENRKKLRIGIPRVSEHLHLRAAVQRIFREPGRAAGEHHLLRLHQFRALPRGREPRRNRSLLPGQDRHLARLQPDPGKAPQEAAQRHLLPDV